MKLVPFIQPILEEQWAANLRHQNPNPNAMQKGFAPAGNWTTDPLTTDPSCYKSFRPCWCIFKHIYWGILHSHECLEPNSVVPDLTHRWWHSFFLLFPPQEHQWVWRWSYYCSFCQYKPPSNSTENTVHLEKSHTVQMIYVLQVLQLELRDCTGRLWIIRCGMLSDI